MGLRVLPLLLVACAEGTGDAPPVPSDVPLDPLADERFAFCHEEGADADQVARWCALLDQAPPDVCPGMRRTCASGDFDAAPTGCDGFSAPGRSSRFEGGEAGDERPWRRREAGGCEGGGCEGGAPSDAFGALLRWGAAGLVALLVVAVARLLLARSGWGRLRSAPAPEAASVDALEPIAGDDDLPLLPEERILDDARRALAEGRLGDAVIRARGAALRRLARRGVLRLHRARTDREYLRAARREGEAGELLAVVLRAVEDHRWAGRTLTAETARAAVEAAARLLAVLSLLVLLLPGTAWAQRRYAPHGDAALHRILREVGWEVVRNDGTFADLDRSVHVVVLDRYAVEPTASDLALLRDWVMDGGVLVLGGDPRPMFPELGGSVLFPGRAEDVARSPAAAALGLGLPVWPDGPTYALCGADVVGLVVLPASAPRVPLPTATLLSADDTGVPDLLAVPPPEGRPQDGPDAGLRIGFDDAEDTGVPVEPEAPAPERVRPACAEPVVLGMVPLGSGVVVGLADPMVLRNGAMVIEANRRLLPDLIHKGTEAGWWGIPDAPRALVATAPGAPDPTPVDAVANARLLPFVLHLFAWWTLLVLHAGWRLSPPRDPPEEGRVDFAEHAAALGAHWARLGATRHAAVAFARLELARLGPEGIAAAALRAGHDAAAARDLVARVEALAADPDGPDDPSDVTTVEELWSLSRRRPT